MHPFLRRRRMQCHVCLSEKRKNPRTAGKVRSARIEVRTDKGVTVQLCEEHAQKYLAPAPTTH